MAWMIEKNIRENTILCESFMELAVQTFHIDFHEWWKRGFWGNQYIPYVITDGTQVAANVSVNLIDMLWNGEKKRYIQLGTVMTAPEHRGKGFSRKLMETVLNDWKEKCDAIYLFANDSVLNFYPKFGFHKADEYQISLECSHKMGNIRKLDMSNHQDLPDAFYILSEIQSLFPLPNGR